MKLKRDSDSGLVEDLSLSADECDLELVPSFEKVTKGVLAYSNTKSELSNKTLSPAVEQISPSPTGETTHSKEEMILPGTNVSEQPHLGRDTRSELTEKDIAVSKLQKELESSTNEKNEVMQEATEQHNDVIACNDAKIVKLESELENYKVRVSNIEKLSCKESSENKKMINQLEEARRKEELELAKINSELELIKAERHQSEAESVKMKEENPTLKKRVETDSSDKQRQKYLRSIVWLNDQVVGLRDEIKKLRDEIKCSKAYASYCEKENGRLRSEYEKKIIELEEELLKSRKEACKNCDRAKEREDTARAREDAREEAARARLEEDRRRAKENHRRMWRRAEKKNQKIREQNAILLKSHIELLTSMFI